MLITAKDAGRAWLESAPAASPTWEGMQQRAMRRMERVHGTVLCSQLSRRHAADYMASLAGLAAGTASNYRSVYLAWLAWCRDRELIGSTIAADMASVKAKGRKTERRRPFPPDALVHVASTVAPQHAATIAVHLMTGARQGELALLARNRVSAAIDGYVELRSDTGKLMGKTAHIGQARTLYVHPGVLTFCAGAGPVLPCPRAYASAVRAAQVGDDRHTPHQIRHLAATIVAGVLGRDHAAALLGHSQGNSTWRYSWSADGRLMRAAADALWSELGEQIASIASSRAADCACSELQENCGARLDEPLGMEYSA